MISETVFFEIPRSRAIQRYDRPSSMACSTFGASLSDFGRWPGCRPSFLPRARAAARPDFTRSLRRSRSNCAIPASMVAIMRPCGVSSSKVIPFMATTETFQPASLFRVSNKSCVDRPHRESSLTRIASICRACARSSNRLRAVRLTLAPEAVSLKTPTTS